MSAILSCSPYFLLSCGSRQLLEGQCQIAAWTVSREMADEMSLSSLLDIRDALTAAVEPVMV